MDKRITRSVSGMLTDMNRSYMLLALLVGVAMLFFLTPGVYFVMPQRDFLPLHTLLELSSVLIAFMVFGVTWHSLSPTRSAVIIWLGCGMLASGLLDLGHALSYDGMPDFVTPSSPEKAIVFWLTARLSVAAALCVASFMSIAPQCKPQTRYALLFGFCLYTLLIYWVVLFHQSVLPRTYIEGHGLTEFKIACEWVIIGILVIAASRFWRWNRNTNNSSLGTYIFSATMIFILGELFFTQHKTAGDAFNVLGHLYKIMGDYLLYQAIFVTAIQAPYHEIERQQTKYRQLFENMTPCVVVYQAVDNGCDFIFLEVNRATELTEKISRNNLIGRRVTELFPGVDDFLWLDMLSRVWRTGQSEHFPVNYYQDGRHVGWREIYLYRLPDGNIVAIYNDITERKLAEQALQESEKNFRAIFETAAIGMAEADPMTGKFVRVNLKFCQLTGYCAQELLSKSFSTITHPDDRGKNMEGWLRMARGEIPEYVAEKRYIHKDGHEIWVHLNVVATRDDNGMILRTLAAITDITARKQADTDRRRYDRELKSIFDALPDFYFRLGSDGTILSYYANPAAMDELFLSQKHLRGQPLIDVLPSEHSMLFAAKLEEQRSSDKIITFEYRLTVSGAERYYEVRLANLADSGDIIVLIRNIVERKQLEQQLQQAQKMEALGQLTGGIAHDFNNILATILGYSNLALERCISDPSDKLTRYLNEVISASERARDLIAKMLSYSRTSSVMADVAPLDISLEVEKAAAMLSMAIPAGIEVVIQLESSLPSVRIDPIDIQQALVNLTVNARDAIGEQGRIDIILKRVRINQKTCAICHNIIEGDFVGLEVKDNGKGIPDNIQHRIFDPFFSTKEIGKGSGLGLSMVQGVIIKNNAHLLIETSPDQGTSFQLLFSFTEEAVTSATPISTPIAPITKRWRIWIVEDQESLTGYYRELLQEQGYLVTTFTDPTEALRAFRLDSDNVDLILTDQTMPHLSGVELAGAVLAIKPKLPVILVTGYSERINADEAIRLGIRCYLNKPVDGKKLLNRLAAELG